MGKQRIMKWKNEKFFSNSQIPYTPPKFKGNNIMSSDVNDEKISILMKEKVDADSFDIGMGMGATLVAFLSMLVSFGLFSFVIFILSAAYLIRQIYLLLKKNGCLSADND